MAWNAPCKVNSCKVIQVHRKRECFISFKVSQAFILTFFILYSILFYRTLYIKGVLSKGTGNCALILSMSFELLNNNMFGCMTFPDVQLKIMPQLVKRWIVLSTGSITFHWIAQLVSLSLVHWIVVFPCFEQLGPAF